MPVANCKNFGRPSCYTMGHQIQLAKPELWATTCRLQFAYSPTIDDAELALLIIARQAECSFIHLTPCRYHSGSLQQNLLRVPTDIKSSQREKKKLEVRSHVKSLARVELGGYTIPGRPLQTGSDGADGSTPESRASQRVRRTIRPLCEPFTFRNLWT